VQEESAQKFIGVYGHLPFAVAMGIVLPTESNLMVVLQKQFFGAIELPPTS
jgi:hypothetical protein